MPSLMDTKVSLVVKVLWKFISLICFRVYLEVNVHKNPTCFSHWSVSSWEAIQLYGATRLSAIIFNLKKKGYNIISKRKSFIDRYGDKSQFAVYYLDVNKSIN